jgi:7,8-dihydropterin-6-yl-methyl-4-(beta-D-ribofuranosyl)aminobenzene 5'-phosphate synthase
VGVDQTLQENSRIRYVAQETRLAEGITLYRLEREPMDTAGLLVEEDGIRKPDDFRHEQYLLLEERGKRILISGCSHKGILNIMDAFRPDILVGGFHFMKMEDEKLLRSAAEKLLQYETVYYTGHCTGLKQYAFLKTIMGDRLHYISTGTVLEI